MIILSELIDIYIATDNTQILNIYERGTKYAKITNRNTDVSSYGNYGTYNFTCSCRPKSKFN